MTLNYFTFIPSNTISPNFITITISMSELNSLVKVLNAYRITLPKKWREKYSIKEGDYVKILEENNELKIIPVIVTVQKKKTD